MGDEIERGVAEELELLRDEGMCLPCYLLYDSFPKVSLLENVGSRWTKLAVI